MSRVNVLMIGTGEYTTGYVHCGAAKSDKRAGVVGLTLFDLRRQGLIGDLLMAGTNGGKFPGIRQHWDDVIFRRYAGIDIEFDSFPDDTVANDPEAYQRALSRLVPGDVVTVFTPDDTHFNLAMSAVQAGCHVLIAKPIVKTLDEHAVLARAARDKQVLVAMEVHKRWDPIYADARDRIRTLGDFGFFTSYMSQPKSQLDTFRAWAGKSSDISYYLNAHHIDFHVWSVAAFARPISVYAVASTGLAYRQNINTEDTITLTVTWENRASGNLGTAVYSSSWIAPRSDVHSQQQFFYLGHEGEIRVDQAHRGYSVATDEHGFASVNPLFMKYEPATDGCFAGQSGYGYRSIEDFVQAAVSIRSGAASVSDFRDKLATIHDTSWVTAILEAGRRSLDASGRVCTLKYNDQDELIAIE